MTTALWRTCGAASATRTPRCNIGALHLSLLLTAITPSAEADVEVSRLLFEAVLHPAEQASAQDVTTTSAAPLTPASVSTSPPASTPASTASARTVTTASDSNDDDAVISAGATLQEIATQNERIAGFETSGGPFAVQLVQEYLDLGQRYQRLGRHEAAIEAFADAEHLSRINAGLVNAELFPIIEASIPSHLAMGDLAAAGRQQLALYQLGRAQFGTGSAELVPLLDGLGDWQMASFWSGLQSGPQFQLNLGSGRSPDARMLAFGNLFGAQRFYTEAIANLLQRRDLDAAELPQLERKFLQTIYLSANREGLLYNPDFYIDGQRVFTGSRLRHRELKGYSASYVNGRSVYERLRFYQSLQPTDALARAQLLVEEGDWHVLFQHHARGLRFYRAALQLLQQNAVPADQIAALLAPALPQQLPGFAALPHSRAYFGLAADAALQWEGWIDVELELSRYGRIKRLDFIDSSNGTDKVVQRRLRRLLLANPFRPRVLSTTEHAPQEYRVRYRYAQVPD